MNKDVAAMNLDGSTLINHVVAKSGDVTMMSNDVALTSSNGSAEIDDVAMLSIEDAR